MIPILELIRLENSPDHGTFGVLKINKNVFCVTLELPNKLNARNVSCIPAGQYLCRKQHSRRFGQTFAVQNVVGRSGILFHAGNTDAHTSGCILLAQYFGKLRGDRAVLNSGKTFKAFMKLLSPFQQIHLTITECF